MALTLLGLAAGWSDGAVAQDVDRLENRLVFAVLVDQVFNHGALDLVDDLTTPDVSSDGRPVGREGFKAMVERLRRATPGFALEVDRVAPWRDRVIARVIQTGRGDPERRTVLLEMQNGLVRAYWSRPDRPAAPGPLVRINDRPEPGAAASPRPGAGASASAP